ncbi:MAG: ABC transporter permease [Thaumarchaeota archaeon]|nr:ABC transporter permease [Candidatus Terraquivivens yellowstonensis]MCL7400463.1 ABC transporter permease [Candidatus Terraquivivens yellowstonensis]
MVTSLRNYVIRRALLLVPVLIGVTLLIFAVSQLFDPYMRASLYITDPRQIRNIEAIIQKYGLNQPFYIQYFKWIEQVLQGNLGWSQSARMQVLSALINYFPATLELTLYAAPLTILVGIILGKVAAVKKDTAIDHLLRSMAIIGWSLPSFWLGIVLLAVFYGGLGIFGPGRLSTWAEALVLSGQFKTYTGLYTIDAILNLNGTVLLDALSHLILPVTTLVIINVAVLMRVMRSSMLEQLNKTYVIAARARGLKEKVVIDKHVTKNALIPIITLSGLLTASMLSGMVITETVFEIKGIGYFAARAATQLDVSAVLGFALFAGTLFVVANLIVDILYAYIDPRIRLG